MPLVYPSYSKYEGYTRGIRGVYEGFRWGYSVFSLWKRTGYERVMEGPPRGLALLELVIVRNGNFAGNDLGFEGVGALAHGGG